MDILKLLPLHNTMSDKNYMPVQWCRKIDKSQSRFPWHLLTPNLRFLAGENNIKYRIFPNFYSPSF